MTTQTSMVAQQTRLRQLAEQIQDCRNRPDGMDIKTWCTHFQRVCDMLLLSIWTTSYV